MTIIEDGSVRVACVDVGEGPLVVLAHSSVSGNRQWRHLIDLLKVRCGVLAPNLIGNGQTTAWSHDRPRTLDDAAEVLFAVCRSLDAPIRLVGHSWGAAMALWAASNLGGRVSHIVAYEPMCWSLLRGREIRWVLRETVEVLRRVFPGWQVEELPGCGHMAPLTHADLINPRIVEFLDRCRAAL